MASAGSFLFEFLKTMIQLRKRLSEGFCPAVLLVDVDGQQETEKNHEDKQQEEDKIACQGKTGPFREASDPRILDRQNDHEGAGCEPGKGVFESHFLTSDKINNRDQNKCCHDERERFGLHLKPPRGFS